VQEWKRSFLANAESDTLARRKAYSTRKRGPLTQATPGLPPGDSEALDPERVLARPESLAEGDGEKLTPRAATALCRWLALAQPDSTSGRPKISSTLGVTSAHPRSSFALHSGAPAQTCDAHRKAIEAGAGFRHRS
jgi:hypothetical protein